MKTGQTRIDEAIEHIIRIGKAELATHLLNLVSRNDPARIGAELSLGSRTSTRNDPQYNTNTRKRKALRALLLCQRVYFSDIWAEMIMVGGGRQPVNLLATMPNWKDTSLAYWGTQTEAQINEGILAFSITTSNAAALANSATGAPAGNHPDLRLTRNSNPFPGLTSCYGAVITWLFKSGIVSYRWYLKNQGASNQQTLRQVFGPAREIWPATRLFSPMHSLPIVPMGHIVHLYVDNPLRWNGHWLVSLGNGNARACNNDDTDGTNRNYTNGCSLNNQFLHGYKHAMGAGAAVPYERGVAEVINPIEIPNRI